MDADRILFLLSVVSFTLAAAVVDVRSRTIPNWLTVPAFVAAVVFHTIDAGWQGLALSLVGFAAGFSILLILMAVGGGGGGDVKLMGALGAWLGWKPFLAVFILGTIFVVIGSLLIVAIHALRRSPNNQVALADSAGKSNQIPQPDARMQMTYALPVALATWLVLACMMFNGSGLFAKPEQVTDNKTSQRIVSGVKVSALWHSPFKAGVSFIQHNAW